MFNLKKFKLVNKLKKVDLKSTWINFSNSRNNSQKKDELFESIISNNKFVEEDLKIRKVVEEMLVKEFSPAIKNHKSYNFLVDSVVNKLKMNELKRTDKINPVT